MYKGEIIHINITYMDLTICIYNSAGHIVGVTQVIIAIISYLLIPSLVAQ